MKGEAFSAERMTEVYLAYLFENYPDNRHIRRIAGWLGLLILGIEELKDRWWISHERQLCFEVNGTRYKAKYDHKIRPRGGISFVEIEAKPGQPEVQVRKNIPDLGSAEAFYLKPRL